MSETRAEILWRLLSIGQSVEDAIAGAEKVEAFLMVEKAYPAVKKFTRWTPELCRRVEEVYAETGSRMETARRLGLKPNSLGTMIRRGCINLPRRSASPAMIVALAKGRAAIAADKALRRNGHAAA